jgi:hypothetical protein
VVNWQSVHGRERRQKVCLGDAFVYRVFKLRPPSFDAYIQPFTAAGFLAVSCMFMGA